jgi:catechol O-methyltransferase
MNKQKGNPFFRWSFLRMILGLPRLQKTWQVGDGREEKLAQHVLSSATEGDAVDCMRAIDEFAWTKKYLINVGDEKGQILDNALHQKKPRRILELGTYCGYSALRMAIAAPDAQIVSIEFSEANASIANRILKYAGVADRITIVVGTLGDGGATAGKLRDDFRASEDPFDFVFIDHDKDQYLPDLELLLAEGMLALQCIAVADNVKFPGAPKYLAYMEEQEGKRWKTTRHETHVEYQTLLKDLVLVSELLEP